MPKIYLLELSQIYCCHGSKVVAMKVVELPIRAVPNVITKEMIVKT